MRAMFVIYVAAGLTLLFTLMSTFADAGHAYLTHHAIATLNPTGDDLERMREVRRHDSKSAVENFALALLQSAIIIYARKLNKQTCPASKGVLKREEVETTVRAIEPEH